MVVIVEEMNLLHSREGDFWMMPKPSIQCCSATFHGSYYYSIRQRAQRRGKLVIWEKDVMEITTKMLFALEDNHNESNLKRVKITSRVRAQ
jgi:hypothetical protein